MFYILRTVLYHKLARTRCCTKQTLAMSDKTFTCGPSTLFLITHNVLNAIIYAAVVLY